MIKLDYVSSALVLLLGILAASVTVIDLPYYEEDWEGNILHISPAGEPDEPFTHSINTTEDWSEGWFDAEAQVKNDGVTFTEEGTSIEVFHTAAFRAASIDTIVIETDISEPDRTSINARLSTSPYWDFESGGEIVKGDIVALGELSEGKNTFHPENFEEEYYRIAIQMRREDHHVEKPKIRNITIEGVSFEDTPLVYSY